MRRLQLTSFIAYHDALVLGRQCETRLEFAMESLGRFMQFLALALLPVAMLAQLLAPSVVRPSTLLIALLFGAAVFYLGRLLEGYGRK